MKSCLAIVAIFLALSPMTNDFPRRASGRKPDVRTARWRTSALRPDARQVELPKPLVTGLKNPTSVVVGHDGKIYVTVQGELVKQQDGAVLRIDENKAVPFAVGIGKPTKVVRYQDKLFVADSDRIWRISANGRLDLFITKENLPQRSGISDITIDPETGLLYAISNEFTQSRVVYRISPRGSVSVVREQLPLPKGPNLDSFSHCLVLDGASHLLLANNETNTVHRIKIADGGSEVIADRIRPRAIAWDMFGRLFLASATEIQVIPQPGQKPVPLISGFQKISGICLDQNGNNLLVVDVEAGTLTAVPIRIPGWEVDDSPLPLETEVAFPDLQWTGWKNETASGQPNPLRPILLTHAGDDSKRVFVATQHGVIHTFPNDQKATQTTVFLDIQERVKYDDRTNEEGFLGLAFHPKFKENGEFFVFYTSKKEKATNVVSRFRVKKDDPSQADPASEEVILKYKGKPFWNHDGGTIIFGPDGYLYITHGDGGAANDPFDNGQKLGSLLGKILRIDVNRKEGDKNYAIPPDNPFVGRADARPEIWAYGLRNVWRMAFDPKTGQLWAADVGQNLYEEINLIERGGNYGWNRREGLHPFGSKGTGVRKEFVEPIWEYHHDLGKSITGGHVYRGKLHPDLEGHYLYADYVSGRIWALKYNGEKKRVVANRTIKNRNLPIMSFGEDDQGEAYLLTFSATGQGIYRIVKQKKP